MGGVSLLDCSTSANVVLSTTSQGLAYIKSYYKGQSYLVKTAEFTEAPKVSDTNTLIYLRSQPSSCSATTLHLTHSLAFYLVNWLGSLAWDHIKKQAQPWAWGLAWGPSLTWQQPAECWQVPYSPWLKGFGKSKESPYQPEAWGFLSHRQNSVVPPIDKTQLSLFFCSLPSLCVWYSSSKTDGSSYCFQSTDQAIFDKLFHLHKEQKALRYLPGLWRIFLSTTISWLDSIFITNIGPDS